MLKEALDLLFSVGQQAAAVQVVPIPGDPRTVLVSQSGKNERLAVPPPPRSHVVNTVDALIDAVKHYGKPESTVVWHNADECWIMIDDDDRRDTVQLDLVLSDEYKRVQALASQPLLDQRQVLTLLRYDLRGCGVEGLVPIFRRLDWKTGAQIAGEVQRGRETLGKTVEAAVAGVSDIPEEIPLQLKVYSTPGIDVRVPVVLGLDPDPNLAKFSVKPLPDELTTALRVVQSILHDALVESLDEKIGVFNGSPNWS